MTHVGVLSFAGGRLLVPIAVLSWSIFLITLILLNQRNVTALASSQAREALDQAAQHQLTAVQYKKISKKTDVIVIDIRSRPEYTSGHLMGARNMPLDELHMRTPREISPNNTVIIYCAYSATCEAKFREKNNPTPCSDVYSVLHTTFGLRHVFVLAATNNELIAENIPFASGDFEMTIARLNP